MRTLSLPTTTTVSIGNHIVPIQHSIINRSIYRLTDDFKNSCELLNKIKVISCIKSLVVSKN